MKISDNNKNNNNVLGSTVLKSNRLNSFRLKEAFAVPIISGAPNQWGAIITGTNALAPHYLSLSFGLVTTTSYGINTELIAAD